MRYQRDGKLYDTATAQCILVASGKESPANPRFYRQALYRKRTGEFFLHCEGGPESPAARFTRPGQSKPLAGEFIQPVDAIGAREFVEEHGGREASTLLDRYFSEPPDQVRITAIIDRQADAMLRRLKEADPTARSQGDIISKALKAYFQATRIDGTDAVSPLDARLL